MYLFSLQRSPFEYIEIIPSPLITSKYAVVVSQTDRPHKSENVLGRHVDEHEVGVGGYLWEIKKTSWGWAVPDSGEVGAI